MARTDQTTRVLLIVLLTMAIAAPLATAFISGSSGAQTLATLSRQLPGTTRDAIPPVALKWAYGTDYLGESYPVIADVDGDGKAEVVVTYGWNVDVVNGSSGDLVRRYSVSGEGPSFGGPVVGGMYGGVELQLLLVAYGDLYSFNGTGPQNWRTFLYSLTGSPAIGDVDGDTEPEVLVGTESGYGYIYSFDGSTGVQEWQYPAEGSGVFADPTIADVNEDGKLDVVVAVGNSQGDIHCLNTTAVGGYVDSLWDYSTTTGTGSNLWYSCPAVADIDNDGHVEIVVGSLDHKVYCLSYTGTSKWNYTARGQIYSSPTVLDIDGDSKKEILFGSDESKVFCLNSSGYLKWSFPTMGSVRSSPAVADVDGDRQLEVMVGSDDGNLYCLDVNGGLKWSYQTGGVIRSSPVVADVDGDGKLEVVFGSNDATLYCLAFTFAPIVQSAYPWPSIGFREDIRHTGLVTDSDHDGLTDNYEIIVGTNPFSVDTDKDGLADYQEFLRSLNPFEEDWQSSPAIALIPGPGNNATMPDGTFGQYGFTMVTTNATNVFVSSGSSLPPGLGSPPSGSASFLYLDIAGTQTNGTTGAAIYIYYNRSLVPTWIDERTMQLHRWNSSTSEWVVVPSRVTILNSTHGVIAALLNHFSYFAVFGSSVSGNPATLLLVAGGAGGAILVVLAILAARKRQRVTVVKKKARVIRKRRARVVRKRRK